LTHRNTRGYFSIPIGQIDLSQVIVGRKTVGKLHDDPDVCCSEFNRDGVTVTSLCPGMSNTGFAQAAQQKITLGLKLAMMQLGPVVRAGIRALHKGRISIVPGLGNKISAAIIWATPRWLHQRLFAHVMNG
jgi:short-subunit dehydrogenase